MDLTLLFPLLIAVLAGSVFLSSRKQKKQMAELAAFQSALAEGDVVITTSGLRGTVVDASYEETVDLEIAQDVVTTWVRAAVREKVSPVAEDADDPSVDRGPPAADTVESGDIERGDIERGDIERGDIEPSGTASPDEVSLEKSSPAKGDSSNGAAHS